MLESGPPGWVPSTVLGTHNWGVKYWGRDAQKGVKGPSSHPFGRFKVVERFGGSHE